MSRRRDFLSAILALLAGSGFIACLVIQALLFTNVIPRSKLPLERLEGRVVWRPVPAGPEGVSDDLVAIGPDAAVGCIVLALSGQDLAAELGAEVAVLVNGTAVADFRYGKAAVFLHRGDLIEVEWTPSPADPKASMPRPAEETLPEALSGVEIVVTEATSNVREPVCGWRSPLKAGGNDIGNAII
ncbi:MAG: hypothetical protein VB144_00820 [Clostridia bacterium]|nr:hypothetical protein [Clostridia bacterium]